MHPFDTAQARARGLADGLGIVAAGLDDEVAATRRLARSARAVAARLCTLEEARADALAALRDGDAAKALLVLERAEEAPAATGTEG